MTPLFLVRRFHHLWQLRSETQWGGWKVWQEVDLPGRDHHQAHLSARVTHLWCTHPVPAEEVAAPCYVLPGNAAKVLEWAGGIPLAFPSLAQSLPARTVAGPIPSGALPQLMPPLMALVRPFKLLAVVCNESEHWRLGRPPRRMQGHCSGQSEG